MREASIAQVARYRVHPWSRIRRLNRSASPPPPSSPAGDSHAPAASTIFFGDAVAIDGHRGALSGHQHPNVVPTTTGNHFVFSFAAPAWRWVVIGPIHRRRHADVQSQHPERGRIRRSDRSSFGIACATSCSNGGSHGGYNDPLSFTVANATIADFLVLSTNAGSLGPAYFAADVVWTADTQNFGATGAIGVTP